MAEEEVVPKARLSEAMDALMKTDEGRELASKIRGKLKDLSDQFKNLEGDDKEKFIDEFRDKFSESFNDLRDSIKMKAGEGDFDEDYEPIHEGHGPPPNYVMFLIAILIVILVFG